MQRLTMRNKNSKTIDLTAAPGKACGLMCKGYTCDGCPVNDALSKLADYEDAEENGLLIHLPCRVGDRTYQVLRIYEAEKRGCTCCTTACGSNTDCEYFDKETDGCLNITGTNSFTIVSRGFKLEDYFDFGKTVFLTREAAEQALKQMGE